MTCSDLYICSGGKFVAEKSKKNDIAVDAESLVDSFAKLGMTSLQIISVLYARVFASNS